MTTRNALRHGLLALLALAPLACSAVQGNQEQQVNPAVLSEEEQQVARDLAERELFKAENHIAPGEKVYFISVELLPQSQADSNVREVLVRHYRYKGNRTVLTRVSLNSFQVVDVKTEVNLPTGLAPEETGRALELVKSHPELGSLFAEYGQDLHVECKLGWPAAIEDPNQPHRNVHVLFRLGGNYLTGPAVVVDLVADTVTVKHKAAQ